MSLLYFNFYFDILNLKYMNSFINCILMGNVQNPAVKSIRVQNPPDQYPPSQIREPLTDRE